MIIYLMDP